MAHIEHNHKKRSREFLEKVGTGFSKKNAIKQEIRAVGCVNTNENRSKRRWLLKLILVLVACAAILLAMMAMPFFRPMSTLMIKDAVTLQEYDRRWVKLEDMSPWLVNAVMMAEDGLFCSHSGIDWHALHKQIMREGGPTRGASTITMQIAKNLFLWHGNSYMRKILEIPLALLLDASLSKRRIMEIYLNIAEWGPSIYGAEAAAQFYFRRKAANLTPQQAALLAVTLPNPYLRNPTKPSNGLNQLARLAQRRAGQAGAYIGCLR